MKQLRFLIFILCLVFLHTNTAIAQGLYVKYNGQYNLHTAADTRSLKFENGHLYILNDSSQADYIRDQIQQISFFEKEVNFKEVEVNRITKSSARLIARMYERANGRVGFQISTSSSLEPEITEEVLAEDTYTFITLEDLESGTKYYFRPFLSFENTRIYGSVYSFTTNYVCSTTGREYVDLGLPSGTLWAAYNVGSKNWSPGYHYYYGETDSRSYSSNNSVLPLSNDAAHESWGGNWRMPTAGEISELIQNCTCESATYGDYSGYLVIGKNGNSIFIPLCGFYYGSNNMNEYSVYLWSSTIYDSTSAYYFHIDKSKMYRYTFARYNEMYIRPVMSK